MSQKRKGFLTMLRYSKCLKCYTLHLLLPRLCLHVHTCLSAIVDLIGEGEAQIDIFSLTRVTGYMYPRTTL